MYCPNCGTELRNTSSFCDHCGTEVSGPAATAPSPTTVLVFSILSTVFCCVPFGIVGVVYAALAMGRHSARDFAASEQYRRNAKTWSWVAFGCGVVFVVIWMMSFVFGALNAVGRHSP